jgi:predicted DNA-binding transcriptional regulator YafY
MKINQKQFDRYKIIHRHLSKSFGKTWEELARCCSQELSLDIIPSRRTVMLDLAFLRDQGAEIVCKNGYYRYAKPFSLFGVLNPDELALANEIKALFAQYAQLPQISGLEEIHLKVEERIQVGQHTRTETLVSFEQNSYYTGQKHLITLYNALKNKEVLKITYQDFGKPAVILSLSPYLLKEYNNRWHLYGYEHTEKLIKNIALDRIRKIETSLFPYRVQKANELSFLENVVGFTRLSHPSTNTYQPIDVIVIQVKKPRAYYINTKPIHQSQQLTEENEESMTFTYQVMKNNELIAELLSYGKDLTVISPINLREEIRAIIKEMNEGYK